MLEIHCLLFFGSAAVAIPSSSMEFLSVKKDVIGLLSA